MMDGVAVTTCAVERGRETGTPTVVVEEREVGRGRGTLGGREALEEGTTLFPWRPKAPPSFVRSVGGGRPGVEGFV